MNALCYKIVFSKRLGTLVAVGEHTSGQGKAAGTGVRSAVFPSASGAWADNFVGLLKSIFACVALSFVTVGFATAAGPAANTLPTGYSVNSGNVAISSTSSATNAAMTIKQTTDKASVNWNSFSIGSGAAVNVVQNNANSVLLNRVVGNDPSQIFGKLTANGQVILINPNGVVFGKGGSVTASAFTASTFGMTDADFNNGKHKFTRNGSTAGVTVEEGARIDTTGYVALMGASVDNQGAITTQGGAVVLATGDSVALPSALTDNISVPLSGKVRLELLPSTLNAMVANSGTITTDGGQVLMQAAALSDAVASITHTGTIDSTGEQGGAVTLLADGGIIKATGSITANSTNVNNKGGDIIIGRDEETGVLARATDVSRATLISKKGFVETSGDHLATDGVSVKAAQWLLDPSDITISNGTNAGYATSGTAPAVTYTPTSSAPTSIVKVSTIKSAIDAGTSVTITTTNTSTSGSGAGNITIADALAFANNSDTNATLSLIADNGITQNTGASITTSAVTGKIGLVHISMTAKGNYQGNTDANALSRGITLNSSITTNGDVTLNGTNKNSTAANAGNAGVFINAGINAKSIEVTGKSDNSYGIRSYGVLNASDKITMTGTGNNWVGTALEIGSVTATNAIDIKGYKSGLSTGYQGLNVDVAVSGGSVSLEGTSVTNKGVGIGAKGSVKSTGTPVSGSNTFGPGDISITGTVSGAGNDAIGVEVKGAITAIGKVNIQGTSSVVGGKQGVYIAPGKTINSTLGDVFIKGTSIGSDGISVGGQVNNVLGPIIRAEKNLTLEGTGVSGVRVFRDSVLSAGTVAAGSTQKVLGDLKITGIASAGNGVDFLRFSPAAQLSATYDILIQGTANGTSGSGVMTTTSSQTAQAPMFNADGKFTLTGTNSNAANTNAAINGASGMQVTAGGHIAVKADTQNPAVTAITFTSNGSNWYGGNASFKSTSGDVLIQSNQGGIKFANSIPTTGVTSPPYTTFTEIKGKNITIDNTGGTVKDGVLTKSTGTATNEIGVDFGSSVGIPINATGNVNIAGASTSKVGVQLFSTGGIKIKAGGDVAIDGKSTSAQGIFTDSYATVNGKNVAMKGESVANNGVLSYSAIEATNGSVKIEGTSTGSTNTSNTLSLQGTITALTDVVINGTNSSNTNSAPVVFINKAVTATNGQVDVTTKTAGTATSGLRLDTGAKLTGQTEVNIKTDSLNITTTAAIPAIINAGAGTGKVTITTDSHEAKINIGNGTGTGVSASGVDVGSTITGDRILGLTNAELNRITAGNLVIGDARNTGGITVSAATTTNAVSGNLTLQTGGSIAINAALTVGDDPITTAVQATKKLSLQAGGNLTQAAGAAIKAAELQLKGLSALANFTLGEKTNAVGKLAAVASKVVFANASALEIGEVNVEGLTTSVSTLVSGITTTHGASITTQTGDLTITKAISNNESGDVVLGAGVSEPAGTQTGGDVMTVQGAAIANNATNGKTYIYTGSAKTTGKLENLHGSLASLYLSSIDAKQQNAVMNTAYEVTGPLNTVPNSTAPVQVMFRDNPTFNATLNTGTLTKTFGTADPTDAAIKSAVLAANTSPETTLGLSTTSSNTFKTSTPALINSLSGSLSGASGTERAVGSYDYIATSNNSKINVNQNATSPVVARLNVVPVVPVVSPIPAPVVPTSATTPRVKIPVGSANPFALASAEELADDTCSINSIENCFCEESIMNKGVDICYEPTSHKQVKR